MTNFTSELIEKAKQAKSSEELAELAKANGMELTAEEAAMLFAQLNPKTGELSDDELENVSGGGCKTTADGKQRTVVSSGKECFTGKFECIYGDEYCAPRNWKRTDNIGLRYMWESYSREEFTPRGTCGRCIHLEFKGGTGYCGVS